MMSEQTANLCTTDACESLRARLAKYEDAEGRPVVATTPWSEILQRAALKAQPSGVVLPERMALYGCDGKPTYETTAHNACLDEVARLNSSPVSAGGVDERVAFEAQLNPHCRKRNEHGDYVVPEIQDRWDGWQARAALSAPSHGEQVREGWQLVPCQPTDAMVQAVLDSGMYHTPATARPILVEEYKAMLAAAPSAASQEQGE